MYIYMYLIHCKFVYRPEREVQWGLKQLLVIRNIEVGRQREVANTCNPMGKSIGSEQNWP